MIQAHEAIQISNKVNKNIMTTVNRCLDTIEGEIRKYSSNGKFSVELLVMVDVVIVKLLEKNLKVAGFSVSTRKSYDDGGYVITIFWDKE
jgi:hypothetical protein